MHLWFECSQVLIKDITIIGINLFLFLNSASYWMSSNCSIQTVLIITQLCHLYLCSLNYIVLKSIIKQLIVNKLYI